MYVSGGLAMRVFIIFAVAYVMSYAFRAINAVIAQPLVQELGLTAGQLGFLASAYFLSFAIMQLPVGVMLDRYGPRRVEAVLIGFAALGALFFALPFIWAKRFNMVFGAFLFSWSFRNYLILSTCQMGECPQKQWALYGCIILSGLILLMTFLPKIKVS